MVERLLWTISDLLDDRLLWTILGLSSSLATEVTHSTKEAGEGDLFVEDFFDFSPRGSRGLRDLSLRSEAWGLGLRDLSLRPEAWGLGLGVLGEVALGGWLLADEVGANDLPLLVSASRASPNVDMSGDCSTSGD